MGKLISDDIKPDRVVNLDESVGLQITLRGLEKSPEGYPRFAKADIEISKETLKEVFGTDGTKTIFKKMKYMEKRPSPKDPSKDIWQEISNPQINTLV